MCLDRPSAGAISKGYWSGSQRYSKPKKRLNREGLCASASSTVPVPFSCYSEGV
jgi:hypothetical protein